MWENIEKIEEVLKPSLQPGEEIINQKITRLTAAGDNYGSIMLSVDVTVEKSDNKRIINAVAKLVPPSEFVQKLFNTPITYRNELKLYSTIIPTLQQFQREHGIDEILDLTAKYLGGRLNLTNDSDKVDENAVLLLENLKFENYQTLDRMVGFDLETSKLVVVNLAKLHATSLALKLKQPEIFKKNIVPYLSQWQYLEEMRPDVNGINLKFISDLCPEYYERAKDVLGLDPYPPPREPFACVTHNDCWVNNILVKQNSNKTIKFVDYQVIDYGSPAKDLIFFLFSSIQTPICQQYCDEFLQQYYETFIEILKKFDCYSDEFSYENFNAELNYEARNSQFFHLLFMLGAIFGKKENAINTENITNDNAMAAFSDPSTEYLEKLKFVVMEFAKRNWI